MILLKILGWDVLVRVKARETPIVYLLLSSDAKEGPLWIVDPSENARLEHFLHYDWRRELVDELRELNNRSLEPALKKLKE